MMIPDIDWRMSASLENVHRGDSDLAEVSSLRGAVRAWQQLDPDDKAAAILPREHALEIDGVAMASFIGEAIAALAARLQPDDAQLLSTQRARSPTVFIRLAPIGAETLKRWGTNLR